MAATTKSATIAIPAAYLEDVRAALVAEINSSSAWLADMQAHLLSAEPDRFASRVEDRDGALRTVRQDVEALDQLAGAVGDTELTGDVGNTLWHMLEEMGRLLMKRLDEQFEYGPVDMDAVLEITERLRWAATQAKRIG